VKTTKRDDPPSSLCVSNRPTNNAKLVTDYFSLHADNHP